MAPAFSRGELWVVGQIVILVAHGLAVWLWWSPGPPAVRIAGGLIVLLGLGLAGVSMTRLGKNLTPNPKPLDDAELVTTGVYRLVRHPIYLSLILVAAGFALASGSLWCGLGALVVLAFFDRKSAREERWLVERYPEYQAYRRKVKKLIPLVY